MKKNVLIIGAGPAGLTAAYQLTKKGLSTTIVETDPLYVGGISRTEKYKEFLFDIGGHRFFSKSKEIENLWTEILPDEMISRIRASRIYYRGQFFSYPLKAIDALSKLGLTESTLCVFSYLKAVVFPIKSPRTFEEWVINQFGERLYSIFFKTYTEKVWGMSCREISADWAAQRIKGLNLFRAVVNALPLFASMKTRPKTLLENFRYPRKGPGMLWEACAEKILAQGGILRLGNRMVSLEWDSETRLWSATVQNEKKKNFHLEKFTHVISSAPIGELIPAIKPQLSAKTRRSAELLKYRDFLTVVLILNDRNLFSDQWIYIHDPKVKVGRIQNFKAWSPEMVPRNDLSCYGMEYFCFEGDGLWNSKDTDLLALAKSELIQLGLASPSDIRDGCIVRQPKAYPVYDRDYSIHLSQIRKELEDVLPTLQMVGRNGMHKYNNQDHAMMTAILAAENIGADDRRYDIWKVNQDAEYQESGDIPKSSSVSGLRETPTKVSFF